MEPRKLEQIYLAFGFPVFLSCVKDRRGLPRGSARYLEGEKKGLFFRDSVFSIAIACFFFTFTFKHIFSLFANNSLT